MAINLSILTVLLLVIFSILYITSYNNINRDVRNELIRLTDGYNLGVNNPPALLPEGGNQSFPDRSISFMIVTDLDGNITSMNSNFSGSDDYLESTFALMTDKAGSFTLEDYTWKYLVKIDGNQILYGGVDFTSEQTYLNNMIFTYLIVFVCSFVLVYFISSYLTSHSLSRVKESFAKQKQFIANASHELKTPLAIISTNTDILMNEIQDNKWLNNIKYETNRMNKLTKDLLYLTKIEDTSSKETIKVNTNLSELVESTTLTFEALAYTKNITFNQNVEAGIFLNMNGPQINQVLHILLDNAIKYTNEGGEISVNLKKNSNNQVVYKISNTGDGIHEEDMSNIFDRFYMGDKSRTKNDNSYGLGLSIASSIIRNHNAKISCESNEEVTTFKIKF